MKKLFAYYNTFTPQAGPNDCGPACLAMVLKYAGRFRDADRLINGKNASTSALSLLELKNIASSFSLSARCVQMDIGALRDLKGPVILHVVNSFGEQHFVVCFGKEKQKLGYRYLIGDPATQVHFLAEEQLIGAWPKSAALYFNDIKFRRAGWSDHPWMNLLKIRAFRHAVLFSVPLLNVFATVLGVAFSWMLQRGINDSPADKPLTLLTAMMVLLLIVTLCRSGLIFVRERLLITLNAASRSHLVNFYISDLLTSGASSFSEMSVRKGFADIQKVQNAVAVFVSILISDGCIISLLTASLWYYEPIAGLMMSIYLTAVSYYAAFSAPLIAYQSAVLSNLSAESVKSITDTLTVASNSNERNTGLEIHQKNQEDYLLKAKVLALSLSRQNMWYEWMGTASVMLVFILCLINLRKQHISYNTLMVEVIAAYFITSLMPKIANAFPAIIEGAQLARRFQKLN